MQRNVFALFLFSFLLSSNIIFGQTSATSSLNDSVVNTEENSNLLNLNNEDWSFFVDEENQIYYIDFETIKVNLSDIIVKNELGEVLIKEDVMNLPVNTIFEIDFSPFGKGKYDIELRSFTRSIEREVNIK